MRRGLVLAVVAHALLVAALSFSVNWHAQVPDAAEAELWASVPQAAAPRAAEPPPQPAPPPPPLRNTERVAPPPAAEPPATSEVPDAQIALERAKQAEQRREEQAARKKEAARLKAAAKEEEQQIAKAQADKLRAENAQAVKDRARATADATQKSKDAKDVKDAKKDAARQIEAQAERLEAQREANLKRIVGEAGGSAAPGATGAAAVSMAPSADYIGRIKGRIRPNVEFPNTLPGNPAVEIEVRVAADGRIMSTRVLKPSGAAEWDSAVLRAIDKTEVLPRDENGRVPPAFVLVYRLRD